MKKITKSLFINLLSIILIISIVGVSGQELNQRFEGVEMVVDFKGKKIYMHSTTQSGYLVLLPTTAIDLDKFLVDSKYLDLSFILSDTNWLYMVPKGKIKYNHSLKIVNFERAIKAFNRTGLSVKVRLARYKGLELEAFKEVEIRMRRLEAGDIDDSIFFIEQLN